MVMNLKNKGMDKIGRAINVDKNPTSYPPISKRSSKIKTKSKLPSGQPPYNVPKI
ncbi:hypothetical protein [Priestia megaterium]|uniref:hypothetical protein n=1 Tax=Priestia megaterium TaxID=1404 RepID=UPI001F15A6EC|nr:hypothetical protein [Priestia megaterium]